jgi:hypothetical protein
MQFQGSAPDVVGGGVSATRAERAVEGVHL